MAPWAGDAGERLLKGRLFRLAAASGVCDIAAIHGTARSVPAESGHGFGLYRDFLAEKPEQIADEQDHQNGA